MTIEKAREMVKKDLWRSNSEYNFFSGYVQGYESRDAEVLQLVDMISRNDEIWLKSFSRERSELKKEIKRLQSQNHQMRAALEKNK